MTKGYFDRCSIHGRLRINGVCLACRDGAASALARDKVAAMRTTPAPDENDGERHG